MFAFIQLRHFHRQRHDMAAIELARSFESPEFARALRVVLSLPDGVTTDRLREMDPQGSSDARELHVWAGEHRTAQGRGKFNAWIQWLCDRLNKHMLDSEPAYLKYGSWKPKSLDGWR